MLSSGSLNVNEPPPGALDYLPDHNISNLSTVPGLGGHRYKFVHPLHNTGYRGDEPAFLIDECAVPSKKLTRVLSNDLSGTTTVTSKLAAEAATALCASSEAVCCGCAETWQSHPWTLPAWTKRTEASARRPAGGGMNGHARWFLC